MYGIESASPGVKPSPIFFGLLALTAASGWLTTTEIIDPGIALFIFVLAGWILSVTFHEFAHAFVAWRAGDHSVEQRGYLTLDPRKYTHPVLSIVMPVIFIVMGGIGLPGGAVMINRGALNEAESTMVALAGPFTNLLMGAASLLAISQGLIDQDSQPYLAAAVGLFGFFQVAVFILNMLPVPGLDGYAAIEPILPENVQQLMKPVAQYGFLILIIALWQVPAVGRLFWSGIYSIVELFGADRSLYLEGLELFRFWKDISLF